MVQAEDQDVLPLAEAGHQEPHDRAVFQVERGAHLVPDHPLQLVLRGVHNGQDRLGGLVDDLCGLAVDQGERGAQRLVPLDEATAGAAHRVQVQLAVEAEPEVDVVLDRVPVVLVEEPEPALGGGDRQRALPGRGRDDLVGAGRGQAGVRRERGDRAVVEQDPGRELDAQGLAHPGHHAEGEQGVAAQLEEVLLRADPLHAEHVGPDLGDGLLDRPLGCARGGCRDLLGLRQRAPVELPAGGEGQFGQRDESRRDHVLRQRRREELPQRRRVRQRLAVGDEVGHQAAVLTGPPRGDRRVGDGRVAQHRGLDLRRLDPEAPDLDLVVGPAEVVQVAGGVEPHDVAGAVHARAGLAEGVSHEPLGGQPWPAEVAAGQALSGDVQLARLAGLDRPQPLVQHVGARAVDGHADGDRARSQLRFGADAQRHTAHGRLGGAVLVDHGGSGDPLPPAAQRLVRQRLAADHQVGGRREPLGQGQQHRQVARGDLDERGAHRQLRRGVVEVPDEHAATSDQRPPHGGDRQVEGDGAVQQRRPRQSGVALDAVGEVAGELPVLDPHALRAAGRTRGVDRVREVFRSGAGGRRRGRVAGDVGPVGVEEHQCLGRRGHPVGEPALGQDGGDPGVGQHERQPLARVGRVQRQVRAAGPEHAEHADDQVGAALGAHADQHVRPDAAPGEVTGELVGPRVEFRIAERVGPGAHRRRVRSPAHLLVERVEQKPHSHPDPQILGNSRRKDWRTFQ
nr:hypothetical protein GCM10020241_64550 [Streptoalloteichus tenebrarius]